MEQTNRTIHNLKPSYKLYHLVTTSGSKYVVTGEVLNAIEKTQSRFVRLPVTGELIQVSCIVDTPFLRNETKDKLLSLPVGEQEKAFSHSIQKV